jgi:hypothetical protein
MRGINWFRDYPSSSYSRSRARKENLAMLMWIASLFVSLFHQGSPTQLKIAPPDKPVQVHGVPADQSIIDTILALLKTDGQPYP